MSHEFVDVSIEDGVLLCPKCGGTYLHHEQTRIFNRQTQDSVTGDVISVKHSGFLFLSERKMSDNPSARRSGVLIDMECEFCGDVPPLAIYQHKGQTFMKWMYHKAVNEQERTGTS